MSDQLQQTLAELDLRVSQAEQWSRCLDDELQKTAERKASLHIRAEAQRQAYSDCQRERQLELQAVADLQSQLDDLDCLVQEPAVQVGLKVLPSSPYSYRAHKHTADY